jgi:MYXO-CTERM domain-containing protein
MAPVVAETAGEDEGLDPAWLCIIVALVVAVLVLALWFWRRR